MSIYRVTKNDFETFTIVTNPFRTYSSSSVSGVTGSVYVFPRRSSIEKESTPTSAFTDVTKNDSDINASLRDIQSLARVSINVSGNSLSGSLFGALEGYLDTVTSQSVSSRKFHFLDIKRTTPSVDFSAETLKKLQIKDLLNPFYRSNMPSANWAYTNYNSLNFFTSSTVPTSTALLYPNIDGPAHVGHVSGVYSLSGAFSFDFYINPRHTTDNFDGHFKAGTILHLSSSYALSLVSGSAKDENGRPVGFRIQLQLSHSADISPSTAKHGTYPSDLIFLSDDNSLHFNRWHHVVVRWGTDLVDGGSGSFNVDGTNAGSFAVPSGTVNLVTMGQPPKALVVGNYYVGWDDTAKFFATDPATRDGLVELFAVGGVETPTGYSFSHPLNAELHDLCIKRYYMTDVDIASSSSVGLSFIDGNVAFYLPPFFVQSSSLRRFVVDHGGILQTPFFEVDGTTDDPFNVALSFGVAGHYINTDNFLKDFANGTFPLQHHLTGVAIATPTTAAISANELLYEQPFVRARNLLIVPCDDGLFVPRFELLASESRRSSHVDDLGIEELSFVHLDELLSTSSLLFGTTFGVDDKPTLQANQFTNELIGFTPEQPGIPPGSAFVSYNNAVDTAIAAGDFGPGVQLGAPLTIYQRTRDASSNQVTMFEISNLFYGKRILPGTLVLRDASLSGSGGAVGITLKDDGFGNIYRADCETSASRYNSVGNLYGSEGLIVIKSPHLFFFGQEGYEISFRGEQNVHVLKLDTIAPANQMNSSSNPNFMSLPPSGFPNDPEKEFVYITGLNFMDENLNVVLKAQLAQPLTKGTGERYLIKTKIDF